MAENGPLTQADLIELKQKITELDKADLLIAQAERAGIDVSGQQDKTRELRDKLMKMKQAFFPGQ